MYLFRINNNRRNIQLKYCENKKNMSSGKRSATSELNHDNWDDEIESEEAGTFSQADENTLKGRVIKKAKRRGLANQVNRSKHLLSGTQGLLLLTGSIVS